MLRVTRLEPRSQEELFFIIIIWEEKIRITYYIENSIEKKKKKKINWQHKSCCVGLHIPDIYPGFVFFMFNDILYVGNLEPSIPSACLLALNAVFVC